RVVSSDVGDVRAWPCASSSAVGWSRGWCGRAFVRWRSTVPPATSPCRDRGETTMSADFGKQPPLRLSALILVLIIGGLIAVTLSAFFGGFSFPKKITLVT